MHTRLVDKIYMDKNEYLLSQAKEWQDFIDGREVEDKKLNDLYGKVSEMLDNRWVMMQDDLIYDNQVVGCYKNPNKIKVCSFYIVANMSEVEKELEKEYGDKYDIFTSDELKKALYKQETPFDKDNYSYGLNFIDGNSKYEILVKGESRLHIYRIHRQYSFQESGEKGVIIPFFRLYKEDSPLLETRKVLFLWIKNKLIPEELKDDYFYQSLLNINFEVEDFFNIKDLSYQNNSYVALGLSKKSLLEDKVRADIKEYNDKILEDTEQGHWSLWSEQSWYDEVVQVTLPEKMVARNPASSIVDGTIGIDFGTKSTIVVYQEDSVQTNPMRIGTGNLDREIESQHYENPTIMEFNNLEKFISDYSQRDGRPFTEWKDLTVSHTAFNSLIESKTDDFNSYISELKQWAGNKNKKLKIVDKNSYISDLPAYIELEDHHINPIELYAYYLGLYINNQHNGIFMNYILSFPVTYELEIRDKIIDSFYKGIKKSLPQELHHQPEYLEQLNIVKGASEPAAYAVTALQQYGFEPEGDEKVFYSIFDFGGGTTDFDFGIWREAQGKKERRYDYTIEHFGAGGDRYLGGENLLELLAFEVFKKNKEKLLKDSIQFILPPECNKFLGSETLLSQSREAKMNAKSLMERLRPFWERHEGYEEEFGEGEIGVKLTGVNGTPHASYSLDIDIDELTQILKDRIHKGVKNFFESLRIAFSNSNIDLGNIDKINIFLAGNSSKSKLVSDLFDEEIAKVTVDMKKVIKVKSDQVFEIFPPLGTEEADKKLVERGLEVSDSLGRPTGKTGVAFGLIDTRKGGDILVLDHNVKEENINFKFYLGESRKKKFKVIVDREEEYNNWIEFIDAYEDTFELYYTTQPLASTNKLAISDSSIKKLIVKIDHIDEDALVYIRITNPTEIEYVVADEDEIKHNKYLGKIQKISLS